MRIVIDCSATMPLFFEDEDSDYAELAFESLAGDEAVEPAIWWYEVRNVLVAAERRKRLTTEKTRWSMQLLGRLPVRVEWAPAPPETAVELARRHGLTVYDAAYLDLAKREGCALASTDRKMRSAARAAGADVFGL